MGCKLHARIYWGEGVPEHFFVGGRLVAQQQSLFGVLRGITMRNKRLQIVASWGRRRLPFQIRRFR